MAYVYNFTTNNLTGQDEQKPQEVKRTSLISQGGGVGMQTPSAPKVVGNTAVGAGGMGVQTPNVMQNTSANAAGKTQMPRSIGEINQSITDANSKLQEKANSFLEQTKANQNYGVQQSDISLVGKQDPTASSKVSSVLAMKAPKEVGTFEAGYTPTSGIDNLENEAGLAMLARRGQNQEFTGGEAAFDARAIAKDPAFKKALNELKGREEDLKQVSQKTQEETQKKAQEIADAELKTTQDNIREWLRGAMGDMTAVNQGEADAANQALKNLNLADIGKQEAGNTIGSLKDAVLAKIGARGTSQVDQAANDILGGDLSSYVTRRGDYGANDFITSDEARQYNALLNMLGEGGQSWMSSADLGPQYTFNKDQLNNDLYSRAAQARLLADDAAIAEREGLFKTIDERAASGNAALQGQKDNYQKTLEDIAKGYLGQHSDLSSFYDPSMVSQYMGENPLMYNQLDRDSVMSQAEADSLNRIATDLGNPNTYQAGQRGTNEDIINDDRFMEWLGNQLNPRKAQADAAAAYAAANAAPTGIYETSPGSGDFRNPDGTPYIPAGKEGGSFSGIEKLPGQLVQNTGKELEKLRKSFGW